MVEPLTKRVPITPVVPVIVPVVMSPAVRAPILPEVEKRFVLEAVVEKRLVVVALPAVSEEVNAFVVVELVVVELVVIVLVVVRSPISASSEKSEVNLPVIAVSKFEKKLVVVALSALSEDE